MTELWESTLRRLSMQFLQASLNHRISTLVVHAKDTEAGKRALSGPPNGHWLRDATGVGRPIIPAAFASVFGAKWPERAIYFGGLPDDEARFFKLCNEAGGLLDVDEIDERVPKGLYSSVFKTAKCQPATLIAWVVLIHELGLQRRDDAALAMEPLAWDDYGVQPADNWTDGAVDSRTSFFFTYSRNTFEDAAAAIDVLLALPPRDSWITIAEAARALNMNSGQVGRDAARLKLKTIGSGRDRRVSPKSVIEAIIHRLDRADRKFNLD